MTITNQMWAAAFHAIYRVMHAAAPVALVSDAEIALAKERDNARHWELEARALVEQRDEARAALEREQSTTLTMAPDFRLVEERDTARQNADAWCRRYAERGTRIDEMNAELAARDARIAELDTRLAQRPAPVPDTPKSTHDFTRIPERDRRMIGR